MKNPIVTLDVGNGRTCFKASNGVEGAFSSLVIEYQDNNIGGNFGHTVFENRDGKYLVGDICRGMAIPQRSTDSAYYSSVEYKVCFQYAMKEIGVSNPYLVVGLPTEFFARLQGQLRKDVQKWCNEINIHPRKIIVLPQHLGVYFDPTLKDGNGKPMNRKVLNQGKVAIVDIGHGTTDLGQFNMSKPDPTYTYGENKGVSDIHKELFAAIQSVDTNTRSKKKLLPADFRIDKQTTVHTMDTWMRDGYVMWKGEKISLEPITRPIKESFAKNDLTRIISQLWNPTGLLPAMIVAGGGATVLGREILESIIDCPVLTSADPSMSIVWGYYEVAQSTLSKTEEPA